MVESEWSNVHSLILYFSLTGNTKRAAEQIQEITGSDIQRIVPTKPYPKTFNDYMRVAKRESELQLLPPVATSINNFDDYDVIFVGYPTWWGEPPRIIDSIFDKFTFAGKKMIAFSTSSSTPFSSTQPHIEQLIEENKALLIAGLRCDGEEPHLLSELESIKVEY